MNDLLNIEYWSQAYDNTEGDDKMYKDALKRNGTFERLEVLWEWKGFSQSKPEGPPESIQDIDFEDYSNYDDQSRAVYDLRGELQEHRVIAGTTNSLVMPSFILHLANSKIESYSRDFPIYDKRVWDSYVYLNRERTDTENLYAGASESPDKYQEYCEWFDDNCPESYDARKFEKALFTFGKTIRKVPTPENRPRLCDIDDYISNLDQDASETE